MARLGSRSFFWFLLLLILGLAACVPGQGVAVTPAASVPGAESPTAAGLFPQVNLEETAGLIVDGVNAARSQNKLSPLRADPVLTRFAKERSADMVARNYFSHTDPRTGEELVITYLKQANQPYQYAGENIAEIKNDVGWVPPPLTVASRYNAPDLAHELVNGWLNSPEHRANIMSVHYRRTGVGLAVANDGRRIVASQVFTD